MALYSYTKKDPLEQTQAASGLFITPNYITEDYNPQRVTVWQTPKASYNLVQGLVNSSKLANIIIPSLFILLGIFFIYKQFSTQIKAYFIEETKSLEQGYVSPVAEEYINRLEYVSNPAGLTELTQKALDQHILQEDTVSQNYKGVFYLSIPSLGFENIPVDANVDSTSESAYMAALEDSLGHFKGTGLPISEVKNNIVIYGHSANASYGPRRNDPYVAFSFLHELRVGDDIYLDIEGKTYHYKMYKSNIVEPSDVSIITGSRGKRTLTLFTCWPGGDNNSRYVAVARPVE